MRPLLAGALVAILVALALLAFPAAASGPNVELAVVQEDDLVALGQELPFTVTYDFTCGQPADPETHIDLEAQGGNTFNITFEQTHWVHTSADCAQDGGTIRRSTKGTFLYTMALPPFHTLPYEVYAWMGNGKDVWAQEVALLRATPDAHLLVGGETEKPSAATRDGDRLVVPVNWTLRNHGKGAFVADVRVDSKPEWMDVEIPASIASNSDAANAVATFTMKTRMPSSCPARIGVVTLAFEVRSPEPRSRAHAEPKVQAQVPCDPSLASQGTPAAGPLLLLLIPALAATRRRPAARRKQQHKR